MDQNKELKKSFLEAEKKEFLKSEKLSREVSALRTQLNERDRSLNRTDFGAAQYQLKIETLELELDALRSTSLDKESALNAEIEKLKAILKEATRQKAAEKEIVPTAHVLDSQAKTKYEAYIVELEGKLQWYNENQELLEEFQKTIKVKDARIQELSDAIDKLGLSVSAKKGLVRRSLVDIQKIKNLESEVKQLKQPGSKSGSSRSLQDIRAEKPSIEDSEYVRHLRDRVKALETENESMSKESEVRIRSLHQDVIMKLV